MREENQIRQVLKIIESYTFTQPLSRFLSDFYKENKQMGSRDRRQASQLVYNYYRLGKALPGTAAEERMAIGCYLCSGEPSPLLDFLLNKWNLPVNTNSSIPERLQQVQSKYTEFTVEDVFPFSEHLSEGIDKTLFISSFFQQPRLFIRIRKQYKAQVVHELQKNAIVFVEDSNLLTLSFSNATALNNLETFKKGYFEIQDKSSQLIGAYFKANTNEYWWDCCAASGGKSLLLIDQAPTVKLLVSDIRQSILNNLKERFSRVNSKNYTAKVLDLTGDAPIKEGPFDGIIVDAPCTGSGTWSRTPEMITGFDEKDILKFRGIQQKISAAVIPSLKPGQPLIYSTCSVFKEENELVVDFLLKNHPVKLEEMTVIKGYNDGADSMFVARLVKD